MADDQQRVHIDIGQLNTSEDIKPVDGLTSAGQPDADEFALFAEAGYVAVVDLRGESEDRGLDEPAVLDEVGMQYVALPLSSPDAISFENAAKLDEILAGYDGPVLLHCGSGNRVGALLALRESLNGASDDDALAYGRSAGMTGLEPVVRSRLAEKE
ncbi:MAG: beta-lactamase hydrolase domain-containing protein [Woeseiaceae bacterium]